MSASISEALAALRRARTVHAESLPPNGPARHLWVAEREAFNILEQQLIDRLNFSREVSA